MSNTAPVINIADIETARKISHGEQFAAAVGSVTAKLGMEKLGCALVVLEPGKRAWPFHLHYGQEELFIILEGEGTLRYDETEQQLRAGDIVFTPTGEHTAHQIINTSGAQLRYLALSTREDPEVCYYPDSRKYGSYANDADPRVAFVASHSSGVDYWKDE